MTNTVPANGHSSLLERVVVDGDLAALSPAQRLEYYSRVCESLGLNPLTKPFDYIKLNGKLTLYARKDATDQIRKLHGVSITSLTHELVSDVLIVTAAAQDSSGRKDTSTGAVALAGLKGEALANAYMKAESKAKRRVTLSLCGLGMLDETEVESIPAPAALPAEASQAVYPAPAPVAETPTPAAPPTQDTKAPAPYYRYLRKCGELKKELGADRYYRILKAEFGLEHADRIDKQDIDQMVAIVNALEEEIAGIATEPDLDAQMALLDQELDAKPSHVH